MMKRTLGIVVLIAAVVSFGLAQMVAEKVDTVVINQIKEEGLKKSQVMDILGYLTDVYGPRLTGSPEYKQGAEWVSKKLASWGLQNIHYERTLPVAKGWTLKRFAVNALQPKAFPVIGYPKAWSPGVKGTVSGEAILFNPKTEADLEKFKGQLKGKFVLMNDASDLEAHFEPQGKRLTDTELLRMANAGPQAVGRRPRMPDFSGLSPSARDSAARAAIREFMPDADSAQIARFMSRGSQQSPVNSKKFEMALKEGVLAVFDNGRGDGGTFIVQSATVPQPSVAPGGPAAERVNPYDAKAPQISPQAVLASEHYNRLARLLEKGQKVKLEMTFEAELTPADSTFNIIAEIPGTDLKDQIVLLGGHFDTWHAGTGATDDCSGVAACMEAARIIKTLGLQPRRTIRLGFWTAEEQGLIGSSEYVSQHFVTRESGGARSFTGGGDWKPKPDYDKLSVYFNHDNGTGKFRGVYMQGNEAARSIFRAWLEPFASLGASTLTLQSTSGTDHRSFDEVNLPGFQFIQDPIEYDSRTHHYNMDVYDRLQADDMKQAATIMAAFAYNAAMRDAMFPRKPVPAPRPPGSN